jgi:hypothetical protein
MVRLGQIVKRPKWVQFIPAIIGAVGSVVGAVSGASSARKTRNATAGANQAELQKTSIQNAVARRDLIRNARSQRAQAIAAGTADGDITTSAVTGATSSITAQTKASLGFFDEQASLDKTISEFLTSAGQYQAKAAATSSLLQSSQNIAGAASSLYGLGKDAWSNRLSEVKVTATPSSSYRP